MEILIFRDLDTRHVERQYEKTLEQLKGGTQRVIEALLAAASERNGSWFVSKWTSWIVGLKIEERP